MKYNLSWEKTQDLKHLMDKNQETTKKYDAKYVRVWSLSHLIEGSLDSTVADSKIRFPNNNKRPVKEKAYQA
jgi:hypothetical protein